MVNYKLDYISGGFSIGYHLLKVESTENKFGISIAAVFYDPDVANEVLEYLNNKNSVKEEFLECANYDTTMEGPKFKNYNRSRLDKLRNKLEKNV